MLEEKDYRLFDKFSLFVTGILNLRTKDEKTALVTRVHTHYSDSFADVKEYMRQQARK